MGVITYALRRSHWVSTWEMNHFDIIFCKKAKLQMDITGNLHTARKDINSASSVKSSAPDRWLAGWLDRSFDLSWISHIWSSCKWSARLNFEVSTKVCMDYKICLHASQWHTKTHTPLMWNAKTHTSDSCGMPKYTPVTRVECQNTHFWLVWDDKAHTSDSCDMQKHTSLTRVGWQNTHLWLVWHAKTHTSDSCGMQKHTPLTRVG